MEVTKELLDKFIRRECTADERSAVDEYLLKHPEKLDEYMDDEEWTNFTAFEKLDPALSQKMYDVIEHHVDKKAGRLAIIKAIGIAASLLVVLGLVVFFGVNSYKQPATKFSKANTVKPALRYNDTVFNKTGLVKIVELSDGSEVSLSPKSELIYDHAFNQKQRNIHLKGEAFFKVAKDKTRPFTVYAGGLSTTALGTSFRIIAFDERKSTRVQLFTGKVVVKQQRDNAANSHVYLTPGQAVELNRENYTTQVSTFNIDGENLNEKPESHRSTTLIDSVIKFNREPLAVVIDVLQKKYNIQIEADQRDLANHYFTGTVTPYTEAPEEVLRTIALLNKLSLRKQNGIYVLSE